MDIKSGYFEAAATAAQIILGFIPDYLILSQDLAVDTEEIQVIWQKSIADAELTGQYGFHDHGTGDWVANASAAAGIKALTLEGVYANIESPIPMKGKVKKAMTQWSASLGVTIRTGTVVGDIIMPTIHNGLCYECVVGATTGTTEPTWSTVVGALSAIDNDVYYRTRELETIRGQGLGFEVGATISRNGEICHFTAFRTDKDKYLGDGQDGVLYLI